MLRSTLHCPPGAGDCCAVVAHNHNMLPGRRCCIAKVLDMQPLAVERGGALRRRGGGVTVLPDQHLERRRSMHAAMPHAQCTHDGSRAAADATAVADGDGGEQAARLARGGDVLVQPRCMRTHRP